MDLHKMMQTGEGIEHLEEHLLDLDSEFRFKCRRCGKCCIHQDTIIFNTRDIYNIAKKKGLTMREVVDAYTEVYIGRNSRIPIIHLLSNGPKGACPLLENGRCSVHDCKPTVCALFPLGRVAVGSKDDGQPGLGQELQVKYIINDYNCGSAKRVNTVRSWLARFGIPEHDEFYLLWSRVLTTLTMAAMKMEEAKVSEPTLNMFWSTVCQILYFQYDVARDFMPQFQAAADALIHLGETLIKAAPPAEQVEADQPSAAEP